MKFIVDECVGPVVARWLRSKGHDAVSVFDDYRGVDDDEVIEKALAQESILVTSDKDFGEKVFREGKLHHGVILMRLSDERPSVKIQVLEQLLSRHSSALSTNFIVVTEYGIRIAKWPS
jgi:predicted nuclease of predicted toxin-antitoxin system